MHQLMIYGASDDLIEVEGDISEEFNHYDDGPAYVAISDGTVLQVIYGGGLWTIKPIQTGEGTTVEIHTATDEDKDYSDRVSLRSEKPFEFVTFGKGKKRSRR